METYIVKRGGLGAVDDQEKGKNSSGTAALLKNALSPFMRGLARAEKIVAWCISPRSEQTYYPEEPLKSKARIFFEFAYWWLKYREFNQYYYMFGLDCASSKLSQRMSNYEFCDFRNAKNMYLQNQEAFSTPFNYLCLMRDKRLFVQLASSLGIPVPKGVATFENGNLSWEGSGRVGPIEEIKNLNLDVICKPADGNCGNGVFKLQTRDGRIFINGKETSCKEVVECLKDGYLLQERLRQHPELEKFHPSSINTVRLVTFYTGSEVRLGWSALRIGAGGGVADNLAKGGVVVKVIPESGKLDRFGFRKPKFGRRVVSHPDTGILFEGFTVPYFNEAVALVKKYHSFARGIHSIGWDVAITPEGPVIIEGNDDWDGDLVMTIDPNFRANFMNVGQYPKNIQVLKEDILKAYK